MGIRMGIHMGIFVKLDGNLIVRNNMVRKAFEWKNMTPEISIHIMLHDALNAGNWMKLELSSVAFIYSLSDTIW